MTVTVFGDSILKGVLYENGRYVVDHSWQDELAKRFGLELRNLSRFGNTLVKALPTIRKEISRNLAGSKYTVLEFGGNDCDYLWEEVSAAPDREHHCKTPPEQFKALYKEAIRLVRSCGSIPILSTLPPVEPDRYLFRICKSGLSRENILKFLGDVNAIYRWEERYSKDVEKLAQSEGTELVDLRGAFLTDRRIGSLICEDGIHPSREGQRLMFNAFNDAVKRIWRTK